MAAVHQDLLPCRAGRDANNRLSLQVVLPGIAATNLNVVRPAAVITAVPPASWVIGRVGERRHAIVRRG